MDETTMILMLIMGVMVILFQFIILMVGISVMVVMCSKRLQYRFEYEE